MKLDRKTTCCDGKHQTIAGALLRSPEWKAWYEYATKNFLFDVDETQECGDMSDKHFAAFMDFVRQEERERARKIIDEVFLRYDKSCEALGLEKRKFVDVLKQEAIKKLNETV